MTADTEPQSMAWKRDEAILSTIQDACDEALRAHRFGLAACYVVNELNRGGWKIVRDAPLSEGEGSDAR